jgi:hypothetical protein
MFEKKKITFAGQTSTKSIGLLSAQGTNFGRAHRVGYRNYKIKGRRD